MKNKKTLLLGLAGFFLFSNEGYSMNPSLLGALNKQAGVSKSSSAAVEPPTERYANNFMTDNRALVAGLSANIIKNSSDGSLQFDAEQCAITHDEIQKYMQTENVPADSKEEVELIIFRKILNKIAGRVSAYASESFKLYGNITALSPEERAKNARRQSEMAAKRRAGATADLQIGGSAINKIQARALLMQEKRSDTMNSSSSEEHTSGESIAAPQYNTTNLKPTSSESNSTISSPPPFSRGNLKSVTTTRPPVSALNQHSTSSGAVITTPTKRPSTQKTQAEIDAELNDF